MTGATTTDYQYCPQLGGLGGEAADVAVGLVLREHDAADAAITQAEAEQVYVQQRCRLFAMPYSVALLRRQVEYTELTTRLERVWQTLQMPAKDRIGMAIKYSGARYHHPCDTANTMQSVYDLISSSWLRHHALIVYRRTTRPRGTDKADEESGLVTDQLTVFPALRHAVELWEQVATAISQREVWLSFCWALV